MGSREAVARVSRGLDGGGDGQGARGEQTTSSGSASVAIATADAIYTAAGWAASANASEYLSEDTSLARTASGHR